jgi:hypothetical protein
MPAGDCRHVWNISLCEHGKNSQGALDVSCYCAASWHVMCMVHGMFSLSTQSPSMATHFHSCLASLSSCRQLHLRSKRKSHHFTVYHMSNACSAQSSADSILQLVDYGPPLSGNPATAAQLQHAAWGLQLGPVCHSSVDYLFAPAVCADICNSQGFGCACLDVCIYFIDYVGSRCCEAATLSALWRSALLFAHARCVMLFHIVV